MRVRVRVGVRVYVIHTRLFCPPTTHTNNTHNRTPCKHTLTLGCGYGFPHSSPRTPTPHPYTYATHHHPYTPAPGGCRGFAKSPPPAVGRGRARVAGRFGPRTPRSSGARPQSTPRPHPPPTPWPPRVCPRDPAAARDARVADTPDHGGAECGHGGGEGGEMKILNLNLNLTLTPCRIMMHPTMHTHTHTHTRTHAHTHAHAHMHTHAPVGGRWSPSRCCGRAETAPRIWPRGPPPEGHGHGQGQGQGRGEGAD